MLSASCLFEVSFYPAVVSVKIYYTGNFIAESFSAYFRWWLEELEALIVSLIQIKII